MKKLAIALIVSAFALPMSAFAEMKECTDLDKAHWLKQEEVQKILSERGYKIVNFELVGSCYKVHLETKEGKQLEGIYNPIGGHPMQRKVE